jgi:hypothetical protein
MYFQAETRNEQSKPLLELLPVDNLFDPQSMVRNTFQQHMGHAPYLKADYFS